MQHFFSQSVTTTDRCVNPLKAFNLQETQRESKGRDTTPDFQSEGDTSVTHHASTGNWFSPLQVLGNNHTVQPVEMKREMWFQLQFRPEIWQVNTQTRHFPQEMNGAWSPGNLTMGWNIAQQCAHFTTTAKKNAERNVSASSLREALFNSATCLCSENEVHWIPTSSHNVP